MIKNEPRMTDEQVAMYCLSFPGNAIENDLALDLRDARAECRALEREVAELKTMLTNVPCST